MKASVMLALALGALAAAAFERVTWIDQRNVVRHDAMRMAELYRKYSAKVTTPAENVVVPVDTYPNGKVRYSVSAEKAYMFLQENLVWGENVVVTEFTPSGTTNSSFRAGNIIVDRKRRCGWVPDRAEIEYSGTIVAGRGNYIDFGERFICISEGARAVSRNIPIGDALATVSDRPQKRGRKSVSVASITADRADYDSLEGVLFFDGHVAARNGGYVLNADRVFVFIASTNKFRRVVAEGSVTMTNGTRSAVCAQAVFSREDRRLVLFGDGETPARLIENGGRSGDIAGSKIVLWTDSEQVEVSDSTITVDSSAIRGKELMKILRTEEE